MGIRYIMLCTFVIRLMRMVSSVWKVAWKQMFQTADNSEVCLKFCSLLFASLPKIQTLSLSKNFILSLCRNNWMQSKKQCLLRTDHTSRGREFASLLSWHNHWSAELLSDFSGPARTVRIIMQHPTWKSELVKYHKDSGVANQKSQKHLWELNRSFHTTWPLLRFVSPIIAKHLQKSDQFNSVFQCNYVVKGRHYKAM